MNSRPLIGITTDHQPQSEGLTDRHSVASSYSRCVVEAGGLPMLLPQVPALVADYVNRLDGLILTGGADPDTRPFGQPLHPNARVMSSERQAFEVALLDHLESTSPGKPVLGICLGMQLMALQAGGTLHQYLPDLLVNPQLHDKDYHHAICPCAPCAAVEILLAQTPRVCSWHRQAVAQPGRLRVVAIAPDGVIEGIDDPKRPWYLGLQWHPERGCVSEAFWRAFVHACQPTALKSR